MKIHFIRFDLALHAELVIPLTHLLHEAYAPLAAQGMSYFASHQDSTKTLERLQEGESYLAFVEEELVGTVTLYQEKLKNPCEYYRRHGVFSFGQFAIRPKFQKRGLGSLMMDMLEKRAKELKARELALDTSEHAEHLIRTYQKRGYEIVAHTQWDVTNYRSVIMSKKLD